MSGVDVESRVRALLSLLKMRDADAALAALLPVDPAKRVIVLEGLERVLRAEVDRRLERRITRRIEQSKLPDRPTLETFDFAFQPTLDKELVLDLAVLAWVERREDLVLVGNAGVGKSHLAKALCLLACRDDQRVLYTTCANMMLDLHASMADGSLRQRLKHYTAPQLLLIDDLGYDPLEQENAREAQLLHKVLEARHGRSSTIVTSNLNVDAWAEYLGHAHLTVALLDKLLYRAVAIKIDGPSYRLAEHKRRARERKPKKPTKALAAQREAAIAPSKHCRGAPRLRAIGSPAPALPRARLRLSGRRSNRDLLPERRSGRRPREAEAGGGSRWVSREQPTRRPRVCGATARGRWASQPGEQGLGRWAGASCRQMGWAPG